MFFCALSGLLTILNQDGTKFAVSFYVIEVIGQRNF